MEEMTWDQIDAMEEIDRILAEEGFSEIAIDTTDKTRYSEDNNYHEELT